MYVNATMDVHGLVIFVILCRSSFSRRHILVLKTPSLYKDLITLSSCLRFYFKSILTF